MPLIEMICGLPSLKTVPETQRDRPPASTQSVMIDFEIGLGGPRHLVDHDAALLATAGAETTLTSASRGRKSAATMEAVSALILRSATRPHR